MSAFATVPGISLFFVLLLFECSIDRICGVSTVLPWIAFVQESGDTLSELEDDADGPHGLFAEDCETSLAPEMRDILSRLPVLAPEVGRKAAGYKIFVPDSLESQCISFSGEEGVPFPSWP